MPYCTANTHIQSRCLIVGEGAGIHAAGLVELNSKDPAAPADAGLQWHTAGTLDEAAGLIHRSHAEQRPFAVVLIDLPGPPGPDVFPALRDWWRTTPELHVILITDRDEQTWESWLEHLDGSHPLLALGRPCSRAEIIMAVRMLHRHNGQWQWASGIEARMDRRLAECRSQSQKLTDQLHAEMAARQQVIAERLELERLLLESQKLDSLGAVASGIAHDFNNLLTAILANASLLRDTPANTQETEENLNHIQSAAMTAAGLCQQMLAYAGKGTCDLGEVDFNRLLHETVDLLRSVISKKARLHVSLSAETLLANADAMQLKQVVMNLVANASDALGDKPGDIQITTMRETLTGATLAKLYRAPDLPGGEYIHFVVSDTGCGMTSEILARAFDPFFTTKFIGRGLGLSAVRGIIRGHRGALRVESSPGEGATFHLLIPSLPAVQRPAPIPVEVPQGLKGRILVVDDEAMVRRSAQKILSRQGYLTVSVENGQQALDMLRDDMETFDLVLLDLSMPELSGVETLREMRRMSFKMPVILMSGYNTSALGDSLQAEAPLDFLPKPFGLTELYEKVAATIGCDRVVKLAG